MRKKHIDPLTAIRSALIAAPLEEKVAFFFESPEKLQSPYGLKSTLHLLRREMQMTLFDVDQIMPEDVARWKNLETRRLFASIGLMMTTIDLLAKMYAGRDDGRIGKRFQRFCREFLPGIKTPVQGAVLWSFRNSLSHSFGLYDRRRGLGIRQHNAKHSPLENFRGTNRWSLGVVDLQIAVVIATDVYRQRILRDRRVGRRFAGEMFSRYAMMPIYSGPLPKVHPPEYFKRTIAAPMRDSGTRQG